MSETEKILARTRLALRRESRQWSQNDLAPEPGAADTIEAIPFYPDASMDTSFSLAQANSIYDSGSLTPANRFRLPKRMLLRFVRFYTDRQVRFNVNVTQVLNGYAKLLDRLAAGSETLKHESAARLRKLEDRFGSLESGLASMREGSTSEHEATRLLMTSELERLTNDVSALRGDDEARDKLVKRLGDEVGELGREAFRELARSSEHHDRSFRELHEELAAASHAAAALAQDQTEALGALRGELAALRADLRSEIERLHGESRQALQRLDRDLHSELATLRGSSERHAELLGQMSRTVTLAASHETVLGELRDAVAALRSASERQDRAMEGMASTTAAAGAASSRNESSLGELREAVAFLRGSNEGQLQMFRDGLDAVRSLGESQDRRLQEASATANAAAEATRRIDRSLEELAAIAHTAKRDVALSGGSLTELRDAVSALRATGDAQDRTIQTAAAAVAEHEGLLAGLRTELATLQREREIHEGALRETAAAATAAADATRRIDRDLADLSGTAWNASRDVGAIRESLGATSSRLTAAEGELTSLVRRGRGLQSDRLAQLYARFEERFRGSPEDIRQRVEVYAQRVARVVGPFSGLPFLDLGCGRGELVAALRDAGILAEGIEANPTFAETCRNAGIPVHQSDLFEELRRRPDGSLAGISAIQVVEHLQAEALVEFLELARAKIAESGLLVLETIDVRSLYALRWFFADPTHVLPLMPETLGFYVENAGFTELEVVALHPVPEPVAPPPGGGKRIERVTEVVFGPQDFALIARRPPVRRLAAVATPNASTARKPRARRGSGRRSSVARAKARSGGKARVRNALRHDTRRKKS